MERILMDLGLEEASEFEYFENFADLVESEADYEEDEFFLLLSDLDLDVFAELSESYFDDLLENVPDAEADFYMMLDGLKNAFIYLAGHDDPEKRNRRKLSEVLCAFRKWYSEPDSVRVHIPKDGRDELHLMSVIDALTTHRLSKLDKNEGLRYDFSRALDFDFGGYDLDLSELIALAQEDQEE